MKKLLLAVLTLACVGCNVQKKAVTAQEESKTPGYQRTAIEIPCKENGFDDAEYFRGTGTATNINQQNARRAALQNAKAMVREKLGGFVQGLSSDYSRNATGSAQASKVQQIIEGELNTVVERELNDAEQTCEKGFVLDDGNFEYWIAIQIPKKKLIEDMTSQLDANEELEMEFNRNQFRKYAEEKMAKIKESMNK